MNDRARQISAPLARWAGRIAIFAASQGAAALPIGEIMMLVGLFLVFFGSGVYIAVVLGALALLSGFIFSDRPFLLFLGQVIWAP